MKVKNLIKNLSSMNPEAEVKLHHHLGTKALFVLTLQNDDSVVWLEDKNDIDIGEELYVRYKECEPDKKKELYYELLEMGFEESDINEYIPEIFNDFKFNNDQKIYNTKFDDIDLNFTERHGNQYDCWVIHNQESHDIFVGLKITNEDIKNYPDLELCFKPLTFESEEECQRFINYMHISDIDNCYPAYYNIAFFDEGCFRAESFSKED